MHCAGRVNAIQEYVLDSPGIIKIEVNLANENAILEYDQSKVRLDTIEKAIEEVGFQDFLATLDPKYYVNLNSGTFQNKKDQRIGDKMLSYTKMIIFVCQCLGVCCLYHMYNMIQYQEGFQNRSIIVIVSIILLWVGYFSLGIRLVSADQNSQTRYETGHNDGLNNTECDFYHCHGHRYDGTIPRGHTNYFNGYSKGYHDGWNKADRKNQQSTQNETNSINGTARSEQVPNSKGGCDPTHQFCAMTMSTY